MLAPSQEVVAMIAFQAPEVEKVPEIKKILNIFPGLTVSPNRGETLKNPMIKSHKEWNRFVRS